MNKDPYITFIGSKGVAFAWIGAAIGPVFLIIGMDGTHLSHLLVGAVSLLLVALSFRDGIKEFTHGSISGFLAFGVVPAILLVVGIMFALLSGISSR